MELLGRYKNGNFFTTILSDGTKIRETEDDEFIPDYAENMDIKITNYCDMGCPFCHEEVEVNFEEVDFNTDYWRDGAWCDCPECGEEVELDDYEYD